LIDEIEDKLKEAKQKEELFRTDDKLTKEMLCKYCREEIEKLTDNMEMKEWLDFFVIENKYRNSDT